MLNREAVEQTVGALQSDGKLRPEHAALVTMVQGLASSVDVEPQNASLWREFRAALETFRERNGQSDNVSWEILESARHPVSVG